MAHAYIMIRGHKMWVDQMLSEIGGQPIPYRFPDADGNIKDHWVNLAVREIKLVEVIFPEDYKDLVLGTLLPDGKGGITQHARHKKFIWGLRKGLGVDKIPEYKTDRKLPITVAHTEMIGVGYKKDYWTNPKTAERFYNPTDEQKKDLFEGL